MKKVFLDDLPRHKNGRIDWKNSIGMYVDYIYDDVRGKIKIIDSKPNAKIDIESDGRIYEIGTGSFTNCKLGKFLGKSASQGVIVGVSDIPTTAPWMIKYFQGGEEEARKYSRCSTKRIYPVCPDCGRIKKRKLKICTIYNRQSIGCVCADGNSYPEKYMYSVLEQSGVDFEYQVNEKWCNGYKYDFRIKKEIILETDGGFHYEARGLTDKTIEEIKEIDLQKDILCKKAGYQMIRIDCRLSRPEYIKSSILNSELQEMVDLSKVDFDECHKFAIGNFKKAICTYFDSHDESMHEVAKRFHVPRSTIYNALKSGSEIGWTNYNPQEYVKKNIDKNCKSIYVFDLYKKYIGEYKTNKIEECLFELTREKYCISSITYAIKNKNYRCKGFLFFDDLNEAFSILESSTFSTHVRYEKINQYNLSGVCIKSFNTIKEASIELGISESRIIRSCRQKTTTPGGYMFRYQTDCLDVHNIEYVKRDGCCRRVIQYDLNGNIIEKYNSIVDAARKVGYKSGSKISECCRGKVKTAKGFIWKYE